MMEYAMHLEEGEKVGKQRKENGLRVKLVNRVIQMFNIEGKFDVPKMTIYNHIKKDCLKVWHLGTQSPVRGGGYSSCIHFHCTQTVLSTGCRTLIPLYLIAHGSKTSSRETQSSGPIRDGSMHATERIIAIMLHSTRCMTKLKPSL